MAGGLSGRNLTECVVRGAQGREWRECTQNRTFREHSLCLRNGWLNYWVRPQKDLPPFSVNVGSAVEEDAQESATISDGGRYKNTPRDGLDRGVLATFYLVSIFFTAG